jgi:hypothetical protein
MIWQPCHAGDVADSRACAKTSFSSALKRGAKGCPAVPAICELPPFFCKGK